MNGTPVWLASVSHKSKTTDRWTAPERATAKAILLRVLQGVGDEARQRTFRMCVTLCMHRALSDAEQAALPACFHEADAIDIAGGPVEIVDETEPGAPSTRPCENPTMVALAEVLGRRIGHMGATFAQDCGNCTPCIARRKCQ